MDSKSSNVDNIDVEKAFSQFMKDVKLIENRDSIMNSKEQIERLNRPGSTYFNLNPFDVLMVDPGTPEKEIYKVYKKFALLLHPDKNLDCQERAKTAFDAVSTAYKTLTSAEGMKKCEEVVEEAKILVNKIMEDKRAALRKQNATCLDIEEDNENRYKQAVYVQTCKLFADLERLRVEEDKKHVNEKKRKLEKEAEEKELKDMQKEIQKNYDEGRENRVSSWQNFAKRGKMSKFKPPKTKMEERLNKKK